MHPAHPEKLLVGPVPIMADYRRRIFERGGDRCEIGDAILEKVGVPNRRAAVSHRFGPRLQARIQEQLVADANDDEVFFMDELPADWRWRDT